MALTVSSRPQENFTFNPKVQTAPAQQSAPLRVAPVQQPQLAPKVVTNPVQPQFNPQVQSQPANLPQINVDNSPRFVPLGEAVKLKYPGVYDDIESGQLGKMVAFKYPGIYDDFILPASPTETKKEPEGARGLKGFGVGAAKGLISTVANIGDLGQKALEKITGIDGGKTSKEYLGDAIKPRGTAEKIGFGLEQVGEFLIPAGSVSKAAKAVDASIQGLGFGSKATKALQLGGKIGLGAGEAAGVTALQTGDKSDIKTAAVLGGAFPIVAQSLKKVFNALPETAWTSILKRTPTEAAKNPKLPEQAVELGMTGLTRQSLSNQAQKAIQAIEVSLDDLLSKSPKKINTAKVAGYLSGLRNSYSAIPGESSSVKAIDRIIQDLYEPFKAGKGMTVKEANELKRSIYQVIAKSYGKGSMGIPAKTEAQKIIANGLKQEIEKVIPEVKTLNQKQAVYIQIKKALDKTIARTEGKGIAGSGIGLYDILIGGIGAGAGTVAGIPLLGLGLVGVKKAAESPLVLSSTAKLIAYFNKLSPTKKLLFYQALKGLTVESGVNLASPRKAK